MKLVFSSRGWKDYTYWSESDRKILKRINRIINETMRNPFDGIGKPEPLKGDYSGYWSRRITEEHRLVYKIKNDEIWIAQARYHYE